MKRRVVSALALALSGVMLLTACGSTSTSGNGSAEPAEEAGQDEAEATEPTEEAGGDTIKIGVFEPITGANAAGGEQDLDAYEFGVHMRPTVLGKNVELIVEDNKSDRIEAANAATRLIYDDKVEFILGCYGSSVMNGGADVIEEAGIPTVCNAANLNVTQDRFWITRLCYLDSYMGTLVSTFAVNELGCKNCVIVRNTSEDYSVGVSSSFDENFKKLTGDDASVLQTIDYTSNDQDFNAIISSIGQLNPDCIFMPGFYSDVGLFASQLRATGLDIPLVSADGIMNQDFIDIAGEASEGAYCNANFNIAAGQENEQAKEFVEAWRDYYGSDPTSDNAVCYAHYNFLLDAIEAVGNFEDKEAIMEWMRNAEDYECLLGTVTMDPEIATPSKRTGCIMQVKDGSFEYVMSVTPDD